MVYLILVAIECFIIPPQPTFRYNVFRMRPWINRMSIIYWLMMKIMAFEAQDRNNKDKIMWKNIPTHHKLHLRIESICLPFDFENFLKMSNWHQHQQKGYFKCLFYINNIPYFECLLHGRKQIDFVWSVFTLLWCAVCVPAYISTSTKIYSVIMFLLFNSHKSGSTFNILKYIQGGPNIRGQ